MTASYITVTGTWPVTTNTAGQPGSVPLSGHVTFVPIGEVVDGLSIAARQQVPAVVAAGALVPVALLYVAGIQYKVVEELLGAAREVYVIAPSSAAALDLSTVTRLPVSAGTVGVQGPPGPVGATGPTGPQGNPTTITSPDSSLVLAGTSAVTAIVNASAYRNRVGSKAPRWGQPSAIVTHFQTGHGWTASNWATSPAANLNDTSDAIHGTQVVSATTPANVATFPTLTKTGATALDLTNKMLRVWVKVDGASDPRNLRLLNLRAASTGGLSAGNYYSWDIQPTNLSAGVNPSLCWLPAGQWVPVALGPADRFVTGSPVLTAIQEWRFAVNDNGVAVKIWFGGVDVYPVVNTAYPNGVVTLCFDDSYAGQDTIARPILTPFGYQASMFPIVDQIGQGGSYTLANLYRMHDELGWEVAPHAFTLANHSGFGSLSQSAIQADIAASLAWMQANSFRWSGAYAYPLGYFGGGQDTAVGPMVDAARTIDSTLKTETFPLGQQYRLRCPAGVGGLGGLGITAYTNSGGILDQVHANGGWAPITLHDVSAGTSTNVNQISQADLTALVAAINSKGVAVATFGDVLRTALNP